MAIKLGLDKILGKPATIPEQYEENNVVGNMHMNQEGWVTSWTMRVDSDGQLYIDTVQTFDDTGPHGTVALKIKRVEGGFEASPMNSDYRWQRDDSSFNHSSGRYVPVVKFNG